MVAEIKKHLIVMIQSLAPFILALVISFAVWNLVFYFLVCPNQKEYHSVKEKAYSNVVVSNKYYEEYPSVLWKLDNIVSFKNKNGKVLNNNTYVQMNNYSVYDFNLEPGEIAISDKMAKKLRLKTGDSVQADISIYDSPREYVIKYIFPYSSDLYNSIDNTDFSVVIIYPEEDMLNYAKGKYNYFLNKTDYDEYMLNQYAYSSRFDSNQEEQDLFNRILIRSILMNVFLLIISCIVIILIHKEINKEVEKYYREGYSRKKLSVINRVDHIIFLGISFTIQSVIGLMILDKMPIVLFCALAELLLALTVTAITGISSEVKYGKAH